MSSTTLQQGLTVITNLNDTIGVIKFLLRGIEALVDGTAVNGAAIDDNGTETRCSLSVYDYPA